MNTESKKAKQVTVNVSDVDKVALNVLKEELKLTDKEMVSVLLAVVNGTDKDVVNGIVASVVSEKQQAKIVARIAKLEAAMKATKDELAGVTGEDSEVEDTDQETDPVESACEGSEA